MIIKKILILIMTTLFILGCNKEEGFMSVDLITFDNPTFFEKTVILFDDNDYLIKTNFDTYISSYPFDVLSGYDKIKMQLIQDSTNQEVFYMTNYLSKPIDSIDILAYHLEKGSCLIFNKRKNKVISIIKMEKWGESPAPLAGFGGRRFYINNKLFLQTTDWIS
jgi:hypothetical protein